ncbi:peptidase associated/transthyretin-like domain-containing protein [Neoroseomonas lacus]|uniref:Uncharacterized protein n=1 Tax=Neoroseomonas lacus TaxID=287609 RepID=A0A917KKW7_9PROT|nr:dioxygenase [Neoroseomonas lacus]GGJ18512.1 hypothetical protein GCM10011320_27310 [Neoroseomonas lacus]
MGGLSALIGIGGTATPKHGEFKLFRDLLGVSVLVDMVNLPAGVTNGSRPGPYQRGHPPDRAGVTARMGSSGARAVAP